LENYNIFCYELIFVKAVLLHKGWLPEANKFIPAEPGEMINARKKTIGTAKEAGKKILFLRCENLLCLRG
jgi:hypothetical protein